MEPESLYRRWIVTPLWRLVSYITGFWRANAGTALQTDDGTMSDQRQRTEPGNQSNEDCVPASNTGNPLLNLPKLPKDQPMKFDTRAQSGGKTERNQVATFISEKAFADATDGSSTTDGTMSDQRQRTEPGNQSNEDCVPTSNTGNPLLTFTTVAQTGGESKSNLAATVVGDLPKLPKDQPMKFDTRAQSGGKAERNQVVTFISEKAFADATDGSSTTDAKEVVPHYKMDAVPRGVGIIINNIEFAEGIPNRYSSSNLTAQLKTLFTNFLFTTLDFTNKTADDMRRIMKMQAKRDHSGHDAFVCFILSHGRKGTVYGVDGIEVDILDFINIMNCPSLEGKPKLFFIEACRTQPSVTDQDLSDIKEELKELAEYLSGPKAVLQDYFIGYSTLLCNKSYRNNETGDIYTQTFIDVMNETGKEEDLMTIMVEVNRRVSERGVFNADGQFLKQFPDMCPRLKKKVYFQK